MGRRRTSRSLTAVAIAGVALAGAFLAGCGGGGGPPVPPPNRSGGFFGVNGQSLRPLAGTSSAPLLDKQLAAIEAGGLSFVRTNFDWRAVEPGPPRNGHPALDFRATDAWVEALATHRLRWY